MENNVSENQAKPNHNHHFYWQHQNCQKNVIQKIPIIKKPIIQEPKKNNHSRKTIKITNTEGTKIITPEEPKNQMDN